MMLFLFDSNNNILLHPDAAKLSPILKKIKPQDLSWIVLVYDHYSPYNQLTEEERIEKASRQVYGDDRFKKKFDSLKEAINEYKGLQYDVRRETISTYKQKIISLNLQLSDEENANAIKSYTQAIKDLQFQIRELELDLVTDETTRILSEDQGKTSLLEIWGEQQRQFKKDQVQLERRKENIALTSFDARSEKKIEKKIKGKKSVTPTNEF